MSRPLCIQQGCRHYRGFIGESRVQAPPHTARLTRLQGFYREKSCPGPFVYSKGVNITRALYGKVVSRPLCIQQGCQYYSGFIGKNRVQAPLYTARVSILQGLYREKSCPGPFVYSKGVNITGWKVATRCCTLIQKTQYYKGCIVKSRAQAPPN